MLATSRKYIVQGTSYIVVAPYIYTKCTAMLVLDCIVQDVRCTKIYDVDVHRTLYSYVCYVQVDYIVHRTICTGRYKCIH